MTSNPDKVHWVNLTTPSNFTIEEKQQILRGDNPRVMPVDILKCSLRLNEWPSENRQAMVPRYSNRSILLALIKDSNCVCAVESIFLTL